MNPSRFRNSKASLALLLFLTTVAPALAADSNTPKGDKERAIAALQQDIKTDPNNAELWLHLGFAYHKMGKLDESQNAFEKAASLNPQNDDALFMLGLIYEHKHQKQNALRVWKQYLSTETDIEKRDVAQKHIHHLSQ